MKLSQCTFLFIFLLGSLGCGGGPSDMPEVGQVKGQVTLNGTPVENAQVRFHPLGEEGGRTSIGVTDVAGNYELSYNNTVKGAKVGQHEVSVSTFDEGGAGESGQEEIVPKKYTSFPSELKVEVKAGENQLDLDVSP